MIWELTELNDRRIVFNPKLIRRLNTPFFNKNRQSMKHHRNISLLPSSSSLGWLVFGTLIFLWALTAPSQTLSGSAVITFKVEVAAGYVKGDAVVLEESKRGGFEKIKSKALRKNLAAIDVIPGTYKAGVVINGVQTISEIFTVGPGKTNSLSYALGSIEFRLLNTEKIDAQSLQVCAAKNNNAGAIIASLKMETNPLVVHLPEGRYYLGYFPARSQLFDLKPLSILSAELDGVSKRFTVKEITASESITHKRIQDKLANPQTITWDEDLTDILDKAQQGKAIITTEQFFDFTVEFANGALKLMSSTLAKDPYESTAEFKQRKTNHEANIQAQLMEYYKGQKRQLCVILNATSNNFLPDLEGCQITSDKLKIATVCRREDHGLKVKNPYVYVPTSTWHIYPYMEIKGLEGHYETMDKTNDFCLEFRSFEPVPISRRTARENDILRNKGQLFCLFSSNDPNLLSQQSYSQFPASWSPSIKLEMVIWYLQGPKGVIELWRSDKECRFLK